MRCKEHFAADLGTVDGVCPTCLQERLLFVIEAQTRANLETKLSGKSRRLSSEGSSPEQIETPRCVSPCRKTENAVVQSRHEHSIPDQRFHSTPQAVYRKKQNKFSIVSNFFRSKSIDLNFDSKPRESSATSANLSPWSISSMLPTKHKKKKSCIFTLTDPNASRVMQRPCRGMSPAEESDGELNSPESSPIWKETPSRASTPMHIRCKRMTQARNITGFAFCLSPLIRPSPNRKWNQKGLAPEIAISGDIRVPVRPHIGMASSFCANRSKKLASCGRFHPPNY